VKLDSRTKDLVKRIRTEANVSDRPGQYDRLQQIADDLKELEPLLRADERAREAQRLSPVEPSDRPVEP
jgi:hypothetical protein